MPVLLGVDWLKKLLLLDVKKLWRIDNSEYNIFKLKDLIHLEEHKKLNFI